MGIRESLLNTITSVGSSDFVRIVTSAGASSKATLANVFKSFESGLGAKSSLTTTDYIRVVGSDNNSYKQSLDNVANTFEKSLGQKSSLTVNDYIRVVGSDNASYKQLVSDLAKKIIENYAGSSLAGSSQSVKSALDALNSKTDVSTSITLSTNESNGTIRAYKVGNLGVVSYMGVIRSDHASDEIIMTFPTGFRPPLSWDFSMTKASSSFAGRIKPNGEVSIWTIPPTGSNRLYFSAVFPLA